MSWPDKNNVHFCNTLDNFYNWTIKWQLLIAYDKCNYFSIGPKSIDKSTYYLGHVLLEEDDDIRDIGITMSRNLKFSSHCTKLASQAYSKAFLILKCFTSCNVALLIRAFLIYVRPLLESCTPVWSPFLLKDIVIIEKIQKYYTRVVCKKGFLTILIVIDLIYYL